MPAFSVNLIVRDGEKTLKNTLSGIKELTDDIVVVVDSRSKDGSAGIAKQFTRRVFVREFDNFSSQRNFAVSRSRYDWIFSLDADELLSEPLKTELSGFSRLPASDYSAYYLPRKNIIFKKTIRHTNWDPDGIIRLFDKNRGAWQGQIHETWVINGRTGSFRQPIIHDNYSSVEEFLHRMNSYTSSEAEQLDSRHQHFSYFRLLWNAKFDFFRRYIWHAGFLDGWHGFYLSWLMAFYHLTVQVKLWQKNRLS